MAQRHRQRFGGKRRTRAVQQADPEFGCCAGGFDTDFRVPALFGLVSAAGELLVVIDAREVGLVHVLAGEGGDGGPEEDAIHNEHETEEAQEPHQGMPAFKSAFWGLRDGRGQGGHGLLSPMVKGASARAVSPVWVSSISTVSVPRRSLSFSGTVTSMR